MWRLHGILVGGENQTIDSKCYKYNHYMLEGDECYIIKEQTNKQKPNKK